MREYLLALAIVGGAGSAIASPESDAADRLIEEGVALAEKSDFVQACARFAAALELREDVRTRGLEAGCNEKLGRIATAWQGYRRLRDLADAAGDAESATFAAAGFARLAPRLSRLVVDVGSAPTQPVIRVDGRPWTRDRWGAPVVLDPGEHEIRLDAAGVPSEVTRFSLRDGEQVHRWIVPESVLRRRSWRRTIGQAAVAVGGLTAIAGGVRARRDLEVARRARRGMR